LACRPNVARANLFQHSHEGDMAVVESFEKTHVHTLVWWIEHKLNDRYHIGYTPIVASLAFLARLLENLTPMSFSSVLSSQVFNDIVCN
jgi:hypothetical protein